MARRTLHIAHLFPDLLNLYADKGNILTLAQRLRWRGFDADIVEITHRDTPRFSAYDLVLLGGGSDREQAIVATHLRAFQGELAHAVQGGLPLLAICGGYQLLGEYYQLPDKEKIPGLGILEMYTSATPGNPRLIGNIAIETEQAGVIMGFENHGGRTVHHHDALGRVLSGHGNDGKSGAEGIRFQNVWGTYIHGPLLPKNPRFADEILRTALAYGGVNEPFDPLDDETERQAREAFVKLRMPGILPYLEAEDGHTSVNK